MTATAVAATAVTPKTPVPVHWRDPGKLVVSQQRGTGVWLLTIHACWTFEYRTWREAWEAAIEDLVY